MTQLLAAQNAMERAKNALNFVSATFGNDNNLKSAFVELALIVAASQDEGMILQNVRRSHNEILNKAAAHTTVDEFLQGADIQQAARSFKASIDEPDLLAAIGKFGGNIPHAAGRVLIASGSVGNIALEGYPKVVRRLGFSNGELMNLVKSVGLTVISEELSRIGGEELRKVFETELGKSVVRSPNRAIISAITNSNTTQVSAGSDPLASLRAGLRAAGPATGYAIAAPAGDVAWLATCAENRGGMGVRGGTFVPGIEIVAIDDLAAMHVIPADRLAVFDDGIKLHPAKHATVNMTDSPESPSQQVSLWQANCIGVLVERYWRLDGDASGVVIVG